MYTNKNRVVTKSSRRSTATTTPGYIVYVFGALLLCILIYKFVTTSAVLPVTTSNSIYNNGSLCDDSVYDDIMCQHMERMSEIASTTSGDSASDSAKIKTLDRGAVCSCCYSACGDYGHTRDVAPIGAAFYHVDLPGEFNAIWHEIMDYLTAVSHGDGLSSPAPGPHMTFSYFCCVPWPEKKREYLAIDSILFSEQSDSEFDWTTLNTIQFAQPAIYAREKSSRDGARLLTFTILPDMKSQLMLREWHREFHAFLQRELQRNGMQLTLHEKKSLFHSTLVTVDPAVYPDWEDALAEANRMFSAANIAPITLRKPCYSRDRWSDFKCID